MMRRMNTMKLPSAPNTLLFPAFFWTQTRMLCTQTRMLCTQTRMLCSTLKVAVATFNARSGRNQITDSMYSIWAAPGEGACASAIGDQGVGRRV